MAARLMAVIETSKMANGLTLASVGMANSNSVSLGVWVKAGARDERTQEVGVAHFLEHMAFKGTHGRTALSIAKDIENVGGFINAHTAREETAYYINLLPEHLEMGFDILSDILLNSTLPAEEIERERGVIIQEIGQSSTLQMIMSLNVFRGPVLASTRWATPSSAQQTVFPALPPLN